MASCRACAGALLAAIAFALPASAYDGSATLAGPGVLVAPGGIAFAVVAPCSQAVALAIGAGLPYAPEACAGGPLGFFDVSCRGDRDANLVPDNPDGCLDDLDGSAACIATDNGDDCDAKDPYAYVTVAFAPGLGPGTDYFFFVGSDRDDNGILSHLDWMGDDRYAGGYIAGGDFSFGFCIPRDPASAGDDWDGFVAAASPDVLFEDNHVGTVEVSLSAVGVTSCL